MQSLLIRKIAVALTALTGTLALSACGSDPPAGPNPNAFTITVLRENGAQSFTPNPANAGGKVVVFKNNDTIVHRVVLNDGSIDTGDIAPGAFSAEFTMPSGGTNYHCEIHPAMVGSVGTEGGAPPPPCEGIYCE
jgi:plastocyanin